MIPAEVFTLQIVAHEPLNILDLKDIDMRSPPFLDITASAGFRLLSSQTQLCGSAVLRSRPND